MYLYEVRFSLDPIDKDGYKRNCSAHIIAADILSAIMQLRHYLDLEDVNINQIIRRASHDSVSNFIIT